MKAFRLIKKFPYRDEIYNFEVGQLFVPSAILRHAQGTDLFTVDCIDSVGRLQGPTVWVSMEYVEEIEI